MDSHDWVLSQNRENIDIWKNILTNNTLVKIHALSFAPTLCP